MRSLVDYRRPLGLAACIVVLVIVWLTTITRAHAAALFHHDLTSLALDSDAIVLARVTGTRTEGYREFRSHEVLRAYAGELVAGELIEVEYGSLSLEPSWGSPYGDTPPSDEVVLFLRRSERAGSWWLTPSGLRVFADDRVYRFEQRDNPGPYLPTPQGHDPYDVLDDPRGGPGLTRAEFEPELLAAIDRATLVRAALAKVDTPEGRAQLLEFVGPAWGDDHDQPCSLGELWRYEDIVVSKILDAFEAGGHNAELLDAISRLRYDETLYLQRRGDELPGWVAVARDLAQPLHRRLAALTLLRVRLRVRLRSGAPPQTLAALVELLDDPDPRIRAAVAAISPGPGELTPDWEQAIVRRLQIEEHVTVLYELTETAIEHELPGAFGQPARAWPLVRARRCGLAFELSWINGKPFWSAEALSIEASPESGEPRILQRPDQAPGYRVSSGKFRAIRGWLLFDPPLADEPTRLTIIATMGTDVPDLRVALPPLGIPPEPMLVARPQPEPIAETPTPPGCACASTDAPGGWLGLLALVWLVRRRSSAAQ